MRVHIYDFARARRKDKGPDMTFPSADKVKATLVDRPAGIINAVPQNVRRCFAGLFNGANIKGWISPDGSLKIGKAECEWDWQGTWGALRDLGLVEWTLDDRPNHPSHGGFTTHLEYRVTEKGRQVREDDLAYYREYVDALDADERANPGASP